MNFNGQHTRARKVNLGGTAPISREELLQRARIERAARAEKREREAASKVVQRHWRMRCRLLAHQDALLAACLEKVNEGKSAEDRGNKPLTEGGEAKSYVVQMLAILPAIERQHLEPVQLARLIEPLQACGSQPWLCYLALSQIWAMEDTLCSEPALASLHVLGALKFPTNEPGGGPAAALCDHFFAFTERFLTAGGCTDVHSQLLHSCANLLTAAAPLEAALAVVKHVTVVHALTTEFLRPAYALSLPQSRLRELPASAAAEVANALASSTDGSIPLLISLLVAAAARRSSVDLETSTIPLLGGDFYRLIVSQSPELTPEIAELLLAHLAHGSSMALTWLSLAKTQNGQLLVAASMAAFAQTREFQLVEGTPSRAAVDELCNRSKADFDQGWLLLELGLRILSHLLTVSTDVQLLTNTEVTLGMDLDSFKEIAKVTRNAAFTLLYYNPDCPRLAFARNSVLMTARQLYIRDGRRQFLGSNFWLMEKYMDPTQLSELTLSGVDLGSIGKLNDQSLVTGANAGARNVMSQMPGFVRFVRRVELFNEELDRLRPDPTPFVPHKVYDISRENLLEDSRQLFLELGSNIRSDFRVAYVHDGLREAGIDGGGLTKELLTLLCKTLFLHPPSGSESADLFAQTSEHAFYPHPRLGSPNANVDICFFAGQVVGKCIIEQVPVMVDFAPFFLRKWAMPLGYANPLDDLYTLDPMEYSSLTKLLSLEPEVIDDLGLTWVASDGVVDHELVVGGAHQPVTTANRLEFVHAVADFKMNRLTRAASEKFLRGLQDALDTRWLRIFSPPELQTLINGGSRDIDIDDLRANTVVSGFTSSKYEREFWSVVHSLDSQQREQLIQFVTSVPKAPLLGFRQLRPLFSVRKSGNDDNRLPTASTCVNLLKLPEYSSMGILRLKLLQAIESNAGFDLS